MVEALHYFTTHGWTFQSKNLPKLWNTLSPEDQQVTAVETVTAFFPLFNAQEVLVTLACSLKRKTHEFEIRTHSSRLEKGDEQKGSTPLQKIGLQLG